MLTWARPRDLALIGLAIGAAAMLMTIVEPYRMARVTGFLDPGADATGGAGWDGGTDRRSIGRSPATYVGCHRCVTPCSHAAVVAPSEAKPERGGSRRQ